MLQAKEIDGSRETSKKRTLDQAEPCAPFLGRRRSRSSSVTDITDVSSEGSLQASDSTHGPDAIDIGGYESGYSLSNDFSELPVMKPNCDKDQPLSWDDEQALIGDDHIFSSTSAFYHAMEEFPSQFVPDNISSWKRGLLLHCKWVQEYLSRLTV